MNKFITWNGEEHQVPSIEQIQEWELDGGCETPAGQWVEPDHPDSWMVLLGLI